MQQLLVGGFNLPLWKWWSSSIGMMIIPNFSWKVIKLWFQSPPTRHVKCALNQLTASWTFWDWPRPWGTEPPRDTSSFRLVKNRSVNEKSLTRMLHGAGIWIRTFTSKINQFCRDSYSSTVVRIWGTQSIQDSSRYLCCTRYLNSLLLMLLLERDHTFLQRKAPRVTSWFITRLIGSIYSPAQC